MATWTSCLGGVESRQAPRQAGVLIALSCGVRRQRTMERQPVTLSPCRPLSQLCQRAPRLASHVRHASLSALAPLAAALQLPRRRLVAPAVRGSRRRRPCAPSLSAEPCLRHVLARPTLPHLPLHAIYLIVMVDELNHAVSPALHQMSPVLLEA